MNRYTKYTWVAKKRCEECKYYEGELVGECKKFKMDVMRFNTCSFYENKEEKVNE